MQREIGRALRISLGLSLGTTIAPKPGHEKRPLAPGVALVGRCRDRGGTSGNRRRDVIGDSDRICCGGCSAGGRARASSPGCRSGPSATRGYHLLDARRSGRRHPWRRHLSEPLLLWLGVLSQLGGSWSGGLRSDADGRKRHRPGHQLGSAEARERRKVSPANAPCFALTDAFESPFGRRATMSRAGRYPGDAWGAFEACSAAGLCSCGVSGGAARARRCARGASGRWRASRPSARHLHRRDAAGG